MIKGITGSQGIQVLGGSTSAPYINQNNNNPMQGMVRIFGSDMQVFDGTAWINMAASYATVSLDGDSQSLLQWAREERTRQEKRKQLVKDNPALANAWASIERAEANFDILAKFVENDDAGMVVEGPMSSP